MSVEEQRELLREQEGQQRRQTGRETANAIATQAATAQGAAPPGYWDIIGNPDIARDVEDDEHLDEFVATELSDKFALGNISKDDWESWGWQIEQEFWTMQNEFKDQDSDLDPVDMAAMYGGDRPRLTNERARRLRSSMQVKKMFTSLSVDARGLKSGTEIHAVTRHEDESGDSSDDEGRLGGLKNKLV